MTAMSSKRTRIAHLTPAEFRTRLSDALDVYTEAMRYPSGTVEQRAPMWLAHILREGWRNVTAFAPDDTLIGVAYGYRGSPGQWWHEQVRRGCAEAGYSQETQRLWLDDYFELTEVHVRPSSQAAGVGEGLVRELLTEAPQSNVLLSTPEGTTRAWRLYRRLGFHELLRYHYFAGDPRPFAVLGRELPLPG